MKPSDIDAANDVMQRATVADAMRALARGEFYDSEEALEGCPEPMPATWDDVEEMALGWPQQAANMRATEAEHGADWGPNTRERWQVSLEELTSRWDAHCARPEHAGWLSNGGPARLWDAFYLRKLEAERLAALLREHGRDSSAEDESAAFYAEKQKEMVRLYMEPVE